MVSLVGGTRQALEERLSWITAALGGTDLAVERLYLILWHSVFMLIAMLSCAFLAARPSTRFVVVTLPPLNLAVGMYGNEQHLDVVQLTGAILAFILVQTIVYSVMNMQKSSPLRYLLYRQTKKEEDNVTSTDSGNGSVPNNREYPLFSSMSSKSDQEDDYFDSVTPPESRASHYSVRSRSRSNTPLKLNTSLRGSCRAKTRVGTPCKLTSLPGRDFCYRHQSGDSVMG